VITALVLLGASALGGAALGLWVRGRRADPSAPPTPVPLRAPIALGDVVVLDEGRGPELWVARQLALRENDQPPWLTLLEADGPAASCAVLACDARDAASFALLRPAPVAAMARVPSTLEHEGESLSLVARRSSLGARTSAEGAQGPSELPADGALLVAVYRGGARGVALVVRAPDRTRLFVGHRVALHEVSVLHVDGEARGRTSA
jgi:hypothetical protein